MNLRVVAFGHRMPSWVNEAWREYALRMPHGYRLDLVALKPEARHGGRSIAQVLAAEALRINEAIPPDWIRVALDEAGSAMTTAGLADRLRRWREEGNTAFIIGSADGLDASIKRNATFTMSLSAMTLPHGLARVMIAEQLYRAASLLQGHPYHRE